jgi:hypothetical protein
MFGVPSDARILQTLTLLDLAGYGLLRLFGARAPATDVVAGTAGKRRARHGKFVERGPPQTPGRDFSGSRRRSAQGLCLVAAAPEILVDFALRP